MSLGPCSHSRGECHGHSYKIPTGSWKQDDLSWNLILLFTGHVTMSKALNFSEPQITHLLKEWNDQALELAKGIRNLLCLQNTVSGSLQCWVWPNKSPATPQRNQMNKYQGLAQHNFLRRSKDRRDSSELGICLPAPAGKEPPKDSRAKFLRVSFTNEALEPPSGF